DAAVRRRTGAKSLEEEPEPSLCGRVVDAAQAKDACLETRVADTNAPATELRAVENEVISLRARAFGRRIEQRDVRRHRRGERVVYRTERASGLVLFEHREFRYPAEPRLRVRDHVHPPSNVLSDAVQGWVRHTVGPGDQQRQV